MDIQMLMKILGGGGGMVGTPQDPWNPAAKIVSGLGGGGTMPKMPGATPPAATSIGGDIGNAIIPQTMAGKGGTNAGG